MTEEQAALSSFGRAVGGALMQGVPSVQHQRFASHEIRESILASSPVVDADSLLVVCWGLGIPVAQLRVFPLNAKRMHAMSVGIDDRAAILLARSESYLAPTAFTVAHELAHIMLGHVDGGEAVVDMEDPLQSADDGDDEEAAADEYALELLTGQSNPSVVADTERFSASQLADAVMAQGPQLQIDPGVLALCAGHATQKWDKAYGALKIIPPGNQDVSSYINELVHREVDWASVADDVQDYLYAVLGIADADV
ncbi:ImmA/IrrE family metallo-endopeptidase [Nocardioides marmorisolisilvae]|uniref:ImmA/IrrE family metallo-endopeptidase n=2 Tax=Nocardioides marmorisolisilvae TaxID=1542737 RepID=A0A3N0DPM4_9ACTN|nr:ImmA/IrrE family metallo-endopeptidase [Nocardioides marmorisolisilvae]